MTAITPTFEIDDSAFVLPDETFAAIYAAKQIADPTRLAQLEDIQYAWLGARAGGIGSVLDDRSAFGGLFNQTICFLTPEADLLTLRTRHAAAVAARYKRIYGLAVTEPAEGVWVVEMVEWGAAA